MLCENPTAIANFVLKRLKCFYVWDKPLEILCTVIFYNRVSCVSLWCKGYFFVMM